MSDVKMMALEILGLSKDDLDVVCKAVRERYKEINRHESRKAAALLEVGQRVKFTSKGTIYAGVLTKICSTKGLVKLNSMNGPLGSHSFQALTNGPVYRVPLAWLQVM